MGGKKPPPNKPAAVHSILSCAAPMMHSRFNRQDYLFLDSLSVVDNHIFVDVIIIVDILIVVNIRIVVSILIFVDILIVVDIFVIVDIIIAAPYPAGHKITLVNRVDDAVQG